jgi:hypothetical protein
VQAPPQTGYALKLSGAGPHKIELRFRVGVAGAGEDRDLQFTAPRLLQSHLRLELPPGAAFVQAVSRYGAETLASTPTSKTLAVDLGRLTGPVHLHWFEEALPPSPVKVHYQEAYYWDLRPDDVNLTTLIHFDVTQGNAQTLDVRLPPELEVRGVEAHRPDGSAIRLQDWRVRGGAGNERSLALHFQSPVNGELLVRLDLVPTKPLVSPMALPLPTPQGTLVGEGGYLAYRARALDVRPAPQRLRSIKNEDFAPFWPAGSRPTTAVLTHAYAFRRDGGATPVLRVQTLSLPSTVQTVQDVRVRVDSRLARFRAAVELSGAQNDLSFAEWDLVAPQPVTVSGVTGAAIRSWSQSGNRLLVWLEKTSGSTKLEIFGWLPLAQAMDGPRFDLPCLRARGAQTTQTTVHVTAAAGLSVTPTRLANLLQLPGQAPSDPDQGYISKQATYEGAFSVRPAAATADVQILTFVEVAERQVQFTTTIDYRIKRGDLRTVQIRLRDWEGKDVKLEAAHVLQQHERRRTLDDRTWTLELEPGFHKLFREGWGAIAGSSAWLWRHNGVTDSYRVTLRGELAIDEAIGGLAAPQVTVADAASVERWLAVAAPQLGVEGVFGLRAITDYESALRAWPGEVERLRNIRARVWKATVADGTLKLVPQDRGLESSPIQVFLREHSASVADNQHWLHEAVYWLRHEAHTDLNLTLPPAARVVGVSLDGVETSPLSLEPPRLWLPLPGRPGVRCLRLRWVYEPPEPLDHPHLETPKLEGAEEGLCLWTIEAPPGYVVDGSSDLKPGLGRAAWLDLKRADAHLQIIRRLVEQSPGNAASSEFQAAQRRFAVLCRQAERTLDASGDAPNETGPGGIGLRDWLQQLRAKDHSLTPRGGAEEIHAEEETHTGGAGGETAMGPVLSRRGVPLYGMAGADADGPGLQLTSETVHHERISWFSSAAWLAGVVSIWGLSFFPSLLLWGRRFVPEQIALAGSVAWLVGWPMTVVLFVLLAAALGRVLVVGSWLSPYLRRPAALTAASSKTGSSVRTT